MCPGFTCFSRVKSPFFLAKTSIFPSTPCLPRKASASSRFRTSRHRLPRRCSRTSKANVWHFEATENSIAGCSKQKKMDVHHVPPWKIYEDIAIYWGSLTKSPLYCVYIYISYSCTKHQSFLEGSDWLYPRCMDLGDRRIIPTWRAFCRNGLCAQIVQGWAWQLVVSRVSQMGLSENRVPFRHTQISCDGSLYPIIPTICSLQ